MASGGDDTQKRPAKSDKERQRFLLSHHRMHRSSVRPFFCCGSQVSLNSITELKELPVVREKVIDDDYEDLTDSDDLIEDFDSLQINTTLKIEKPSQRPTRISSSKRKKTAGILQEKSNARNGKKFWTLKLRGKLQVSKRSNYSSDSELTSPTKDQDLCVCTSYKASTNEIDITGAGVEGGQPQASVSGATVSFPLSVIAHLVPPIPSSLGACGFTPQEAASAKSKGRSNSKKAVSTSRLDAPLPFVNLNELYPINDIDEQLIAQRRQEMEQGIEVEDVWVHKSKSEQSNDESYEETSATVMCSNGSDRPLGQYPSYGAMGLLASQTELQTKVCRSSIDGSEISGSQLSLNISSLLRPPLGVHTQVDYKHYLVPDMEQIVNSSFYWGVMDRYQAEKLIENKAEGTFLLRDSAQDEFLFSVSFRRYGRSLHARIEQWNHKFSFDSRDPGVFATDSVCGLIEHYKDPSCCMFFEPMLTLPLHRTFPFSLQHLTRATICSRITYDSINQLTLPTTLKEYLRFYHYKQKVRVRRFDNVVA